MAKKAVRLLKPAKKGFFLMVEGGLIDKAHHANEAERALIQIEEFDKAISGTIEHLERMGILNETLIIVTADHGHTFTFGSYGERGDNLREPGKSIAGAELFMSTDDHTQGGYYTGPGIPQGQEHLNAVSSPLDSVVKMNSASHSGEDVPLYAKGPFAHMVSGTHEQSYIGHVMQYASCAGSSYDREPHCRRNPFD